MSTATLPHRIACATVLIGSLVAASSALAEPSAAPAKDRREDGDAAAQALYLSATQLMDQGRYADARPKLEEVTRLVPEGVGAQITLAQCDEALGRYASAWSEYRGAEQAARQRGQTDRADRVAAKINELEPRLSRITVEVPAAMKRFPGLVVERDGVVVVESKWGSAIPVDAGDHEIDIRAPGKVDFVKRVHVALEASERVVAPETLADAPSGLGSSLEPSARPRTWQLPLGLATGGTGIVAVAVGLGLGGAAMSKAATADRECDPALRCSQQGLDLRASATSLANASTGLIVAGALFTTAGIVLVATSPSAPRRELRAGLGSLELVTRF